MKFRKTFLWLLMLPLFFIPATANIEAEDVLIKETGEQVIYMFGRDDCGFCQAQKEYMDTEPLPYIYLNIIEDKAAALQYDQVVEKHGLSKVTPITVVGEKVFLGWNSARTTGEALKEALYHSNNQQILTIEQHLAEATPQPDATSAGGCSGLECDTGEVVTFEFDLPVFGVVDLRSFSLFSLSIILGIIDGFNPCAMWVLVTFLVLLSQAGSKKKMIFLAGLFMLAEGIMYNLILNVWYQTWDFVALDHIVTPLVGFLAVGGAIFFLWRWHKNRETALVCDISSIEQQSRTMDKFKAIANQPVTIASILAILIIAFSVNIIEFACSIGIPQAYTKILEINLLEFWERQWYIFVFTIGYMLDDVLVFALAIWGYDKLQAHGQKYAQYSLLIGGILMLVLGLILVLNPAMLVL
ncbi:glutaredoxin [Candidatus Kaiserbacteria bacterium]|nr:glutaredoxin [Candidatus Kaiserbacteria bacterium]